MEKRIKNPHSPLGVEHKKEDIKDIEITVPNGYKNVSVPERKEIDVYTELESILQIKYVQDVTEVSSKPQAQNDPFSGDSLQFRKIRCLRAYCDENAWPFPPPKPIEYGLQFDICPMQLPELEVKIYYDGTHSPKTHYVIEFQKLIDKLADLDESKIPLQPIEKNILIEDPEIRILIRNELDKLRPVERPKQDYCKYHYQIQYGREKIIIHQYNNGKLHLQGKAGDLYERILDVIMSLKNRKNPNSNFSLDDVL